MKERVIKEKGEKIIKKVMRHWSKFDKIEKKEFEEGLGIIIENISMYTNTPVEVVAQHTHQIIEEFSHDYKKVPDQMKGYEAMISMLYFKYMIKLGFLKTKMAN